MNAKSVLALLNNMKFIHSYGKVQIQGLTKFLWCYLKGIM